MTALTVWRIALLSAAAAGLALGSPHVAAAAPQGSNQQLSAADLFDLADQAGATGNAEDALTIYRALARDPDAEVRAEARFRKGMLLADAGRHADAAVEFRALLDEKPNAARVRLELARILAELGDEAAARRELRQARVAGLPADVASTVEQFARALRSQKRFGGSLTLAFAPDSNINRATQARTLDTVIAPLVLSEDARARSGSGLKLGGDGFARLSLGDDVSLLPRVAATANLYRSRAFEDISASALLGLEWRRGRDRLNPSIGQSWRWYGGRAYARTQTVSTDWLHPLGMKSQLAVSASASRARYLRNSIQNGAVYDLNISLEHALSGAAGAGITLSATRQTARDPGYATVGGGVSLLGWQEFRGATLFAAAGIRRTEGDTRLFLFPDRRREWLLTARAGATMRRLAWKGFAPKISLTYERNISTVGIYDYRRVASEFGIVRAF